ncbi:DUF4255 domain-containing protein [Kribbella sp. DT2]|uniref:DUF4255 domain-containing protein n=1 Tax=Kribbella sp. DT2 TaxID=3393427 RepID=UPI003CFA59BE
MLDDLGTALSVVLRDRLPGGTVVRLDPPDASWAEKTTETVGVFLHRVLEAEVTGTVGGWTEDRTPDGRVAQRTSPERRYDFCYLVTAWATDLDRELALLGGVLGSVVNDPLLPVESLPDSLARARGPVMLAIGRPGPHLASPELWTSLGLRPRSFLDLVVTAPVPPVTQTSLPRHPDTIDLGVAGSTGTTSPAGEPPRADSRAAARPRQRPTARITEGARDGQPRGQAR